MHDKIAAQQTRRTLISLAAAACFPVLALANPSGPTVANGSASFASNGSTLSVTNSPGAIINWQQFGIGANETTRFNQQSAQSAVLNRVTGGDPTQILGNLQSNGQVFLVNPWGVLFGRNAVIDVNKLVASTLNLSDADFIARRFSFNGGGFGSVVNQGRITTPLGGSVWLIGSEVRNEGVITSPQGQVLLAAGTTVSLIDSAGPELSVTLTADGKRAVNLGEISAAGGRIDMYGALIDQQGLLAADSASVDETGRIRLLASDTLTVDGRLSARGVEGDGGFIETSGARVQVAAGASIDTRSATGRTGTWLIDPNDYTIAASGGDISGAALANQLATNNVTIATATMGHTGNGDITVNDAVNWGAATTLTLQAERNLGVSANLSAISGSLLLGARGNLLVGPWLTLNARGGMGLAAGWDGASALTAPATASGAGDLTIDRSNVSTDGALGLYAGRNMIVHADRPSSGAAESGQAYGSTVTALAGNNISLDTLGSNTGGGIANKPGANTAGLWANSNNTAATTMSVNAGGTISLTAASAGSGNIMELHSNGGQSITAQSMVLTAGSSGLANYVSSRAFGIQTLTLTGSGNVLTLTAGGSTASDANNFAHVNQSSPTAGSQTITFTGADANVVLQGGAGSSLSGPPPGNCTSGCAGNASVNEAVIKNASGNQTLDFQRGGSLSLYGGTKGNINTAYVSDNATSGMQTIGSSNGSASYPAIALTGGTSGGGYFAGPVWGNPLGNFAVIASSASQTVQASALTLRAVGPGSATAAVAGGAGIGQTNTGGSQSIAVNGALTMVAGDGQTAYPAHSGAAIFSNGSGGQTISAQSLSLTAGVSGFANLASIQAAGTQAITLSGSGNVLTLTGGGSTANDNQDFARIEQGFDSGLNGSQTIRFTGANAGVLLQGGAGSSMNGSAGGCPSSNCAGNSSNNFAGIRNYIGNQTLDFQRGGSLSLYGGSRGNTNNAYIYNSDSGAMQTIGSSSGSASYPAITLYGGTSGGAWEPNPWGGSWLSNNASFRSDGSQTIQAASISLQGVDPAGATGPVTGGAGIVQTSANGSQSIAVNGAITMTAGDGRTSYPSHSGARIYAAGSAGQSITAQSMTLNAGAAGNFNAAEVLATNGPQSITLTGSGSTVLSITGGGSTGDSGNQAAILHQNYDLSVVPGNQSITLTGSGAGIKLQGGAGSGAGNQSGRCLEAGGDSALCASSSNQAHIYNQGATQSVAFSQGNGSILLIGGTVGRNNSAGIDGNGALSISGNPDITLHSGASGGASIFVPNPTIQGTAPGFGNDVGISTDGALTINARNVTLDASTAAAGTVSRVLLGGGTSLSLNATGNVALTGGASAPVNVINNATHPYQDKLATVALLGTLGGGRTTLNAAGNLTVTGGSGTAGQVIVGAGLGAGDVGIKVGGNITLTGNSGGVYLGASPVASTTSASNTITTLLAGNTVTFNSPIYSDMNSGSGNLLVVSSPKFVNNAGASLFSNVASGNRWLVYSHDPASNITGGLTSGNPDVYGASYATTPPAAAPAGNRFIYEFTNTVTDPCAINPAACQATTLSSTSAANSQQVSGTVQASNSSQSPLRIDVKLTADASGGSTQLSAAPAPAATAVAAAKSEDKPVSAVDRAIKADEQKSGTELRQEAAKAKDEAVKSSREAKKAEGEAKRAEVAAKKQKSAEGREAAGAEAEARKAEATAHQAGAEAKAAEAEAKLAALEAKAATSPEQRGAAQARQVAAETRKVTAESKQAVAEAKQSAAEARKASVETKQAEIQAKSAKTPQQRAAATQKLAEKKVVAEIKKSEVDAKTTEADAHQASADALTLKAPGARLVAEKRADAKQAESAVKAANVEVRRAEHEAGKADVAAKQARTPGERTAAVKRAQEHRAQAGAKREEARVKQAEAGRKSEEHRVAEQKRGEERKAEVAKAFAAASVAKTSKAALSATVDERHELKTEILKAALNILERDPNATALPPCGAGSDVCVPTKAVREASFVAKSAIAKPTDAALPQIQRKLALLVGINDYASPKIPKLEAAVGDAEAVGKVMHDKLGYEVRYLKNATQADIVRAINKLGREVGPQDSVTVYYAGHGYLSEDKKVGYWIPADGGTDSPAKWISNSDIEKLLNAIPAKQILLVSDSCYSGALTREQKVDFKSIATDPAKVLAKRSVTVMSSGSEEPVSDEGRDGRSIFAWHLMESLKGVARYAPAAQLYQGVRTQVSAEYPQTPQYGASIAAGHSSGGDYLIETRSYK